MDRLTRLESVRVVLSLGDSMDIRLVTIGADPEVFFSRGDEAESAEGKVGGEKHEPLPVSDNICILEDNVAAEFTISPSADLRNFASKIKEGLSIVNTIAEAHSCGLLKSASAEFSKKQLATPQARTFGCDPDFDAYSGALTQPAHSSNKNMRSAGGHLHLGLEPLKKMTFKTVRDIVSLLDTYLGIPFFVAAPDYHRKKLYGNIGAFRPKPYGLEYRTLPNTWIFNDALVEWVYNKTNEAVKEANKPRNQSRWDQQAGLAASFAWVSEDVVTKIARDFVDTWKLELPPV